MLRVDRGVSLHLVRPLLGLMGSRDTRTLPVLMYHSVAQGAQEGMAPYFSTRTSPSVFEQHLLLLQQEGYRVVDLPRVMSFVQGRHRSVEKEVAITFDDGYQDFYAEAFPLLRRFGFTATVFLATRFIGRKNGLLEGLPCLSWEEVREMRTAGIQFGSHTVTHPRLVELDVPAIRRELVESKAELEDRLQEPVHSFAYPFAFPEANPPFVSLFLNLLQEAGYQCNLTTRIGRVHTADHPYLLRRLPANSYDDKALLAAKLGGAYDWLALVQRIGKFGKRWIMSPSSGRDSGIARGHHFV